jgi:hypothetical protein
VQWVRLDASFPRNHKVLAVLAQRDGYRTMFVYMCGLAYCGEQETDGYIPREALAFIHARPADAARLVEARFWFEHDGGWRVHNWEEFQPSSEEMKQRRVRAEAGSAARWNGHVAQTGAERTRRYRERKAGS